MLLDHLKGKARAAAMMFVEGKTDPDKLHEAFMEKLVGSLYKDAVPW